MQKSTMAYVLTALMLSTAVIYFVAAAGESAEAGEGQDKEQAPASNRDSDNDETINSAAQQEERSEGSAEEEEGVREEEGGLATQVQTAFFLVVGLGYAGVGVWMLKDKGKTNPPYIIAIGGSIAIIGLYVASRTVNLPIVGLQEDVGTIDILSKVLQVAIIGLAAYMINTNKVIKPLPNR